MPLACERSHKLTRDEALAKLVRLDGGVTVRLHDTPAILAAMQDQNLFLEDTITTGPDGHAQIVFNGGTTLDLQPQTSLVIRRVGGTTAELGAILISGAVVAKSVPGLQPVSIKTPFGIAELSTRLSEIVLSVDKGVRVAFGEIAFTTPAGDTVPLRIGQGLIEIGGVVVDVGGEVEGLNFDVKKTPKPRNYRLSTAPKMARVRGAGTSWKSAPAESTLQAGDQVRLESPDEGAKVGFEEGGGTLTLSHKGQVDFTPPDDADSETSAADYSIPTGHAKLHLPAAASQKQVTHTMRVAGLPLKVRPTVQKADIEVDSTGDSAQVMVRYGQMTLDGNVRVEAGSKVTVAHGKVVRIEPLTPYSVDVLPHVHTLVYFQATAPAINFKWGDNPNHVAAATVELAKDANFEKVVAAEQVHSTHLILDRLRPDSYYWRVNKDTAHGGTLSFVPEDDEHCADCQYHNVLKDNGGQTVVYFQQKFPEITFEWASCTQASAYNLKVFKDGNFDHPIYSDTHAELQASLSSDTLPEGDYFWFVHSLDPNGQHIKTGRVNALHVAYDNVLTSLHIRSPRPNARLSAHRTLAYGEAALGTELSVNGQTLHLDSKGRFRQRLALEPGEQQVVFRNLVSDGQERVYVRHVTVR